MEEVAYPSIQFEKILKRIEIDSLMTEMPILVNLVAMDWVTWKSSYC